MMQTRIARRVREHDWFGVSVELIVVVLGILIAFQVDRWREARHERALEHSYVLRLSADVELDIPRIERSRDLAGQRLKLAELLIASTEDSAAVLADPGGFLHAVEAAAFTNAPALARHTYDDLRATGHLRLIRSDAVKQALYAYHDYDESARQWHQLSMLGEQHYFELVAGVIDATQSRWLAGISASGLPDEQKRRLREERLDPAPVLAALDRLKARQAAVDWLPQLTTLQLDQLGANTRRLELARNLLTALREHAATL